MVECSRAEKVLNPENRAQVNKELEKSLRDLKAQLERMVEKRMSRVQEDLRQYRREGIREDIKRIMDCLVTFKAEKSMLEAKIK